MRMVPVTGTAGLLKSHMLALARESRRLSRSSAAAAMDMAIELALETLAGIAMEPDGSRTDGWKSALYAAARDYIELHFHRSDLTAEQVASSLGCSRAHLYRVFAERGEGIGQTIRNLRLDHAGRLLSASPRTPVEQVAFACGFSSPAAFSRAFRDYSGMSPTRHRRSAR